jgi:hypothetical protein
MLNIGARAVAAISERPSADNHGLGFVLLDAGGDYLVDATMRWRGDAWHSDAAAEP